MENTTKILGDIGEKYVAQMLKNKNFTILVQNYRTRWGEVDLIAQRQDLVVFVEVKTRKKAYFPISNVVTLRKQRKITRVAQHFIVQNNVVDKVCRFDVAMVIVDGGSYEIEYIENAFYAKN